MTKRRPLPLLLALALVAGLVATGPAAAQAADKPVVLVWGGSYGFRHPSITAGELALTQLGLESGKFDTIVTENPATLTAEVLANVDVLAWISTTGKPPFTQQQRDDIIRFAYCGGGTMAFHAAADSNYGWADYAELIGAQFDSHPKGAGSGAARMIVEDNAHPITQGWAGKSDFLLDDEYYRWRGTTGLPGVSLPRSLPDTHVLLSLDETTVGGTIQQGPLAYEHHQPIAWTKSFRGGGRVYYNNMGHSESTWSDPQFRTSLVNGVGWVTEKRLDLECYRDDNPLPPPAAPPAADPLTVGQPCTVPDVPARSGATWQRSGALKRLTEAGDSLTLPTAGLPGNLSWGAQFYVLDLSATGLAKADVIVELGIPNPLDDYDLSVTTGWGWYGSQANQGATAERVVIRNAPHCAVLQMYGDNLYAVTGNAPSLTVSVVGNAPYEPPAEDPLPDLPPSAEGLVVAPPNAVVAGFAPPTLALPQGSSLRLMNQDSTTHDITSNDRNAAGQRLFASTYTNNGETAVVVGVDALPAGSYGFHCSLHGQMTGTLVIQ